MKNSIFLALFAIFSGCSTAPEASTSSISSTPNRGEYTVRFEAKNRCLESPVGREVSGRWVTGSNPFQHMPCGRPGQSFLFRSDDIKEAGAYGAYLTETSGKVLASSSSPWTVSKNAAGSQVIQSRKSGKCLVAGARSEVALGSCDDANAAVSLSLRPAPRPCNGPVIACSTDNQGNAEDCICMGD